MSVTLLPGADDENDSIMFIRRDLEGGRGVQSPTPFPLLP